jgi:TolA-binding protein
MRTIILFGITLWISGCVVDRTGRSASEVYRRELALQGARIGSVESQFDNFEDRVVALEEVARARSREDIRKLENMEQVRAAVAEIRGDLELIRHEYDQSAALSVSREEDAAFRLAWLENRADELEKAMGMQPPAPPADSGTSKLLTADLSAGGESTTGTQDGVASAVGEEVDAEPEPPADADGLVALAEEHLAGGRERAAEAVLNRFLDLFPDHDRVAEVLYRRAESHYNGGDYAGAVLRFQEVIDGHRESKWAPWAMLRQGEAFDAQGQTDNARLFYEDVTRIWPKSRAAKDAKKKLNR